MNKRLLDSIYTGILIFAFIIVLGVAGILMQPGYDPFDPQNAVREWFEEAMDTLCMAAGINLVMMAVVGFIYAFRVLILKKDLQ